MRQKRNMDQNWKFYLGDLPPKGGTDGWGGAKAHAHDIGAAAASLNDTGWRRIDIPHDFVMEGDYTQKKTQSSDMRKIPEMESMDSRHLAGGSLEGGIGWYRKRFETLQDCEGKRIYLHFDGVYRDSTVYLNDYYIGRHEGGYTGFYYDITDFINIGGENLLAVRVDATGREGWWYEGGGIYRHVWMEIKEDVSVAPFGIFVCPKVDLTNGTAVVEMRTEIESRRFQDTDVEIEQTLFDAEGREVLCVSDKVTVSAWGITECLQSTDVKKVVLWDLENPYLYRLETVVYVDDAPTDRVSTPFGIRHIRFDADRGFYLNGKNIRIQGLCCHHDSAGVGIAANESIQEYRIAQMKRMGANAYRSAHHMPAEELLDICDRVGMLVFSETRRMSSAPEDLECLRMTVRRGRNHPSVFLWGIGNEEIFSQHRPETVRTTHTMKAEVHKLDPSRPITSAVVCWNGRERFDNAAGYVDVTKHLDVMGFNYCKTAWDDYHERMPSQPIMITEASSNSGTRGCYSTDEATGQYYIYDPENGVKCKSGQKAQRRDMGEGEWKYFAQRPYLAGIFLWTGMDYRGEPTPLAYPAVYSQFGIFDYCGFPKDNFYYYKSWWTDEPVLHLFPHWNFPEKVGEKMRVLCYSNAEEVELFVNGVSYGRKAMEKDWYLEWENVVYEPGELMAKGYRDGQEIMAETVRTTGAAAKIELEPYKAEVNAGDTAIIQMRITDMDGAVVPTADNELHFEVRGAGEFLGTGNGNPGSHERDKVPVRRAFNGLCQLLVKATEPGRIEITASSAGIKSGACVCNVYGTSL